MKPSRYEAQYDEKGRVLRCDDCLHLVKANNRRGSKCRKLNLAKDGGSYRCQNYSLDQEPKKQPEWMKVCRLEAK